MADHPEPSEMNQLVPVDGEDVESSTVENRGTVWNRRAALGGFAAAFGGLTAGLWHNLSGALTNDTQAAGRHGSPVPLRGGSTLQGHTTSSNAGELPAGSKILPAAPVRPDTPIPAKAGEAPQMPPLLRPEGRAQVALVIDDLGLKQAETAMAVGMPGPMTLAFLPYGQQLARHSARAEAHGHEVIVHLPMEAGSTSDTGPNALRIGLPADEIERRLQWSLAQVPGHVGLNNHMGSVFTESATALEPVLKHLKQVGKYFLDSRTTARSAAREIAARIGLPYAERDVFLDNRASASYVMRQLQETEALARRYGTAIAIGHPHRETLAAISRWMETLESRKIDLVPVSTIISTRGSPYWRLARDRKGGSGTA